MSGDNAMHWDDLDLSEAPVEGPVAFHDNLSPDVLLDAYRHGLYPFPADTEEQKILSELSYEGLVPAEGADPYAVAWCSPDPRPVIFVDQVRIQRSLRQQLRNKVDWTTTLNACFDRVVEHCRTGREPRWLTDRLVTGLLALHEAGHAHSVEVWDGDTLVGGTFGVRIGGVFSADSQFMLRSGAAKVAVACLVRRVADAGGVAVDVQHDGEHAKLIGAVPVSRARYLALLANQAGRGGVPAGGRLSARRLAEPVVGEGLAA
ncbi:leucyl/phenylalanyl-tRNA--protein transferase [Actinophytocola oryzae]|uniref:Leucyl/phenylalanyl-tRNA--protein transferase n=1 Tax=Actinophytocola oryzae TaxID=502181 RepID=A0A4R7V129_9PSEU|nr:leucyl/phenylalanyl-tRNA--protein transferase [Actinophytocola oryzae]TDV42274.1 leucyl/phenylalanyl-tRNA--protein transferase [Actinophytocola oryzae]